jgi:hypothetical protein
MAVRRLPREDWEKKLRSYGCRPAEGLTPLNTAEWWRWPFPGPPFTVPIDDEGYCDAAAFQRLIADMARLAPPGWQFPDPYNF